VESTVGKGTQFYFIISLPAAEMGETGRGIQDLRGKRMVVVVRNTRLIRLLAAWADELAMELITRSDPPEKLDDARPDYLVIDADQCEVQIPQFSLITAVLLTRSKNISELANRYPNTTVLSLPLKKRRFLQAIGVLSEANEASGAPKTVLETDPMLSRLNILVVDDNIVNRRVCVAQLQKLGVWSISEAEDGRQAIVAARDQSFDLILMDVQMPVIDGLEATHQIRLSLSNSNSKQPRIIGLTANALREERQRCLEAGMDDKLSKPVPINELKAVLQATDKILSADRPPSTSGSNLPVCDEGQWKEFLEVDDSGEFVTQVLELFVAQSGQLASRLPNLAGDPEVLADEVHKLKGAAANVGATRAAYFCEIVEKAAKLSHPFLDQRAVTDLKESLVLTVSDYQKRLKNYMNAVRCR
jgi:CheY-like chemotaxis protein/HPt (histidine-containing phosphotransfer) domain-containing protein